MRQFFRIKLFTIATGIVLFSTITIGILTLRYVAEKGSVLEISLVESNLSLVRQTLNRIELLISNQDQLLYAYTSSSSLDELRQRLQIPVVGNTKLVKQIYLLDTRSETVLFPAEPSHLLSRYFKRRLAEEARLAGMPLLSIHHLHTNIEGRYYFFSLLLFTLPDDENQYLLLLEYRLDDLDLLFGPFVRDLEPANYVCIRDYDNNLIYGTPVQTTVKYFVEQRFPNTFYKWLFQLVPRNVDAIEQEARNRRLLNIFLVAIDLLLLLSAWFLVYMSRREEIKLTRQKEEFIRNVSHELKTPLALIKMFSEILLMGRGQDERTRQEYLEIIFAETERMTHLVNNVLDFSNLEKGLQRFNFEDLPLDRVIRKHLEAFDYRIKKEKVDLVVEAQPDLPPIRGDRNAMALVLLNLLDNGIKYGPEKGKIIRIRIYAENGWVCLRVQDNGIGMLPEETARIFEKFYRSDNIAVRRIRGSGIGLSLVKYVVDAHGGTIQVDSATGEGSAFTIRFPARGERTGESANRRIGESNPSSQS
jgi:two-component system phosphate regulon sensor histidine kinase PhoR